MSYTPAFLEIFLAWSGAVAWAWWLRPRVDDGPSLFAVSAIPWITGAAVVAGQAAAATGLMQSSPTAASQAATDLIRDASVGSAVVVLLALVIEGVLTARWYARRRSSPT